MFILLALAACTPDPDKPGDRVPTDSDTDATAITGCPDDDGQHGSFLIEPYVQLIQPSSAWILWETETGLESRVDYGLDDSLGSTLCGALVPVIPGEDPTVEGVSIVHEVQLTGLTPNTTYRYQARTGDGTAVVRQFTTAPDPADEASFRMVAMGDSQRDASHPDKYREVLQEGVMATAGDVDMVLFAGDLVDNGWLIDEWREFFAPGAELMAEVPFYPVIGNHEGGSPHFFRYFHLPDDGDAEHYYTLDYSNVRVIGLDSNGAWADDEQLSWLDDVLAETCSVAEIDFVFAQLHHPFQSEVWTPGNTDWTGEVIDRLETFSTDCEKPSVHFFGHTHAYSRGQSQEHRHVMVNVSGAGGALDRWGEQAQEDYPEFSVSQDDYGFVVVDVQAGDDPLFTLQRISRGTPDSPLENALNDELTIPRYNIEPATPAPIDAGSVCVEAPTLTATAFDDLDFHAHQASQWQIAATCGDFATPLVDRWRQDENWYMGVDSQAGDDLEDEDFPELWAGQSFCWRVRYRDSGMAWSAWSAGQDGSVVNCP